MAHSIRRKPIAPKYFVPFCLYPHTKYRTKAGVKALFEKYEFSENSYLIVIADRLFLLDRLVTGRYWSIDSATIEARQQAVQIHNLVKRISHNLHAHECGRIVFWDAVAETAEFADFSLRLRKLISADGVFARAIEEFATQRVKRFGLGAKPEREQEFEREYLLSEVCMSVYCTEILGYWIEVWERPPAPDQPDPLKLLYTDRIDLLEQAVGRPAVRILEFLFPDAD